MQWFGLSVLVWFGSLKKLQSCGGRRQMHKEQRVIMNNEVIKYSRDKTTGRIAMTFGVDAQTDRHA